MTIDEAINELRHLNQPVPKPMRLPTADEIQAAEEELGLPFPADYRKFLRTASDVVYGYLEPATLADPTSHTHLLSMAVTAWDLLDVPRGLLPICEDNGNYYCIESTGRIVFWDHNGTSDESWQDLATWIQQVWIDKG